MHKISLHYFFLFYPLEFFTKSEFINEIHFDVKRSTSHFLYYYYNLTKYSFNYVGKVNETLLNLKLFNINLTLIDVVKNKNI